MACFYDYASGRNAFIYEDINVPAYCGMEFPDLEPDKEIMQNWMGLHLEYAIILVMTKNYNAREKQKKVWRLSGLCIGRI